METVKSEYGEAYKYNFVTAHDLQTTVDLLDDLDSVTYFDRMSNLRKKLSMQIRVEKDNSCTFTLILSAYFIWRIYDTKVTGELRRYASNTTSVRYNVELIPSRFIRLQMRLMLSLWIRRIVGGIAMIFLEGDRGFLPVPIFMLGVQSLNDKWINLVAAPWEIRNLLSRTLNYSLKKPSHYEGKKLSA